MNPILFRFFNVCYLAITAVLLITALCFAVGATHDYYIQKIKKNVKHEYALKAPVLNEQLPAGAIRIEDFHEMDEIENDLWIRGDDGWTFFFIFFGTCIVFQMLIVLMSWIFTGKAQSPKEIFLGS